MTQIQIKRGLEADRSSVTPAAGELLYTTDEKKVYVGDGTTAGGNEVGGGGGPSVEAIASGALANGDMVVVNSDGTVSTAVGYRYGTLVDAYNSDYISAIYDSVNQKVVVAYKGSYGWAAVGTVSGTTISFGTPVKFETGFTNFTAIAYDSANEKIVIAYEDDSSGDYGTAVVGTVSGTSISFGTPVVFESSATSYHAATYDSVNQKVVLAFKTSWAYAIVGTVSGTSISFGTKTQFVFTGNPYYTSATYDSANGKVVLSWTSLSAPYSGTAIVGTVSGTSISFGAAADFFSHATASPSELASTYDSGNSKVVFAYRDSSNSNYGTAVVGTVSGTSISYGTPVVFNTANTAQTSAVYNDTAGVVAIGYTDGGNLNRGTVIKGTVSGTSISFDASVAYSPSTAYRTTLAYDNNTNQFIVFYGDSLNSYYLTSMILPEDAANITSTNFIGISDGDYSDGSTAIVQIIGSVDDAQSGLTAGQVYYLNTYGELDTTPDTPEIFVGTAISSTKLIVKA